MSAKRRSNIFIRVFLLFGILVLANTLFFALMIIPMQKNAFNKIMFTQAETVSRSIIQASSDAFISKDYGFIVEHNLGVLKNNSSIYYLIISPRFGDKLLINQKSWRSLDAVDPRFVAMENDNTQYAILSYDGFENVYHFVFPIKFLGNEWGWIHIGFSTDDYNNSIRNMYHNLLYIIGFSFLIIMLVGYFFARWISLPVSHISQLATQVASGDFSVRSSIRRGDEIGVLSDSFNSMVDSLRHSKQQLHNYNQELEAEVLKRTHELADLNKNLDLKIQEELTKSKKQEALLIHQSRSAAMGEMIGAIAHQWRQPLNALALVQQNLKIRFQMGTLDEEFMDKSMEKSDRLIQKMSTTIDDFRNFFKPNKNVEAFNVKAVIQATVELLEAQLKNHSISLDLNCPDDINMVGLSGEFSQVVLNLINNAKDVLIEQKSSFPAITINVTRQEHKQIQVIVKDNAGGVPADIFDKIFDPYFTTKEEGKGTGIGLYMSKIIIENNMGGLLHVFNDDEGANFVIQLKSTPITSA
jgi:nitrogen fixation/metabolism regulation signal transduction histidine kinase